MDLVYVPEVLTYGFFRGPQYRDYELPWNKDHFSYEGTTQVYSQQIPQHHEPKVFSKENCYLCKENKRRSLAAYIRGKARKNCQEIHEEEEEEENVTNIKEKNMMHDDQISK